MKQSHGVVALIDILGVSSLNIEDCAKIISIKNNIIETVKQDEFVQFFKNTSSNGCQYFQFGDSILLCSECTEEKAYSQLSGMALLLKRIILNGIEKEVLIRGALSYGEYIEDISNHNVTVIGPAIADVASWYEEAQWAGAIATPKAGLLITKNKFSCQEGESLYAIYNSFVPYMVPTKSSPIRLWVVSWPLEMRSKTATNPGELKQNLLNNLSKFKLVPKGTEKKYSNTLEFIEYCWQGEFEEKKLF